jgi:hypothetical protein
LTGRAAPIAFATEGSVLVNDDGEVVAHRAVIDRTVQVGSVQFRAGYVEAVATLPAHQRGASAHS